MRTKRNSFTQKTTTVACHAGKLALLCGLATSGMAHAAGADWQAGAGPEWA
ncbi:MAG: hypothetical protein JWQ00_1781, partial [Noviherbaspirillum sp.]|nr:hypothetical protein [Noviherbaspirillum sp.]